MRYIYGTLENPLNPKGRNVTAKQLASIIKRDVEFGKWNLYTGGDSEKIPAHCQYKRNGFVHHEQLLIYGTQSEFKNLENLLKGIIKVIPRKFKGEWKNDLL